jgi:hypothetical protein
VPVVRHALADAFRTWRRSPPAEKKARSESSAGEQRGHSSCCGQAARCLKSALRAGLWQVRAGAGEGQAWIAVNRTPLNKQSHRGCFPVSSLHRALCGATAFRQRVFPAHPDASGLPALAFVVSGSTKCGDGPFHPQLAIRSFRAPLTSASPPYSESMSQ